MFVLDTLWGTTLLIPHSPQKETRNFLVAGFLFFGTTQAF
jgi:hypothetical protein